MNKIRKWLTQTQANTLNLKVKPNDKGRNQARYSITKEQLDTLYKNTSSTKSNEYSKGNVSAVINGKIMPIQDYCKFYGLDYSTVSSYKLVSHTGTPFYNIVFHKNSVDTFDYSECLKQAIKNYKPKEIIKSKGKDVATLVLTDIHFGACVKGLDNTPDFSIDVLVNMLQRVVARVNDSKYKKVNVFFLGDLIESFTGHNHKNTLLEIEHGQITADLVINFAEIMDKYLLSKIHNLGKIKMIAGNHDRVTSDNKEDVHGGGAKLIAKFISLMGYDIEFSSSILTYKVGNIVYILNHGHLPLTKRFKTNDFIITYGDSNYFNFVLEGHLHSRIVKDRIQDDSRRCRRQVCASMFTGNTFSEHLGYTSQAGFTVIVEDKITKKPNVFDYTL